MTNHALNFGIDQFLSSGSTLLRIGGIVLSQQFKFDSFVANFDTSSIQLFDRHFGAVFVVFTQVGNGTACRANVTNFDDLSVIAAFFATGNQGQGNSGHGDSCQGGLKGRQVHSKLRNNCEFASIKQGVTIPQN